MKILAFGASTSSTSINRRFANYAANQVPGVLVTTSRRQWHSELVCRIDRRGDTKYGVCHWNASTQFAIVLNIVNQQTCIVQIRHDLTNMIQNMGVLHLEPILEAINQPPANILAWNRVDVMKRLQQLGVVVFVSHT